MSDVRLTLSCLQNRPFANRYELRSRPCGNKDSRPCQSLQPTDAAGEKFVQLYMVQDRSPEEPQLPSDLWYSTS